MSAKVVNYIQTKRKNRGKYCVLYKQIRQFRVIKHQPYKQIIVVYMTGYQWFISFRAA